MNHCQGGIGTDTFNKVKVLEEWVEQGKKPSEIIASHLTNGQVDKTRPCALSVRLRSIKAQATPTMPRTFPALRQASKKDEKAADKTQRHKGHKDTKKAAIKNY